MNDQTSIDSTSHGRTVFILFAGGMLVVIGVMQIFVGTAAHSLPADGHGPSRPHSLPAEGT